MNSTRRFLTLVFCAAVAHLHAQTLVERLSPFVESHALAGAVTAIATSNAVLQIDAVGCADIANNRPMKPDTLFWIASQTKAMTAAALMILADEGKVKLDDPVTKFIPQFNNQWVIQEVTNNRMTLVRASTPITVRHLLSHTSGMPFASDAEQPRLDNLPLRDAVYTYALTPLRTDPGTKYSYSNAGINTAGRIIEIISGMTYEAFMQTRLFAPLGMKDTTFWPTPEQESRIAKSYRPDKAGAGLEELQISQLTYPLGDHATRYPMPAGGLFSTAADVARFCQMLLNNGTFEGKRILSEASVQAMTTKQTGTAVADNYGLGLATNPNGFGHGGAQSTNMSVERDRGLVTVYLVQHAGFPKNGNQAGDVFANFARERIAQPGK